MIFSRSNFSDYFGSGSDLGKVPDRDPTSYFFPVLQNYSLSSVVYPFISDPVPNPTQEKFVSDPIEEKFQISSC
jgi:hypothetical protein